MGGPGEFGLNTAFTVTPINTSSKVKGTAPLVTPTTPVNTAENFMQAGNDVSGGMKTKQTGGSYGGLAEIQALKQNMQKLKVSTGSTETVNHDGHVVHGQQRTAKTNVNGVNVTSTVTNTLDSHSTGIGNTEIKTGTSYTFNPGANHQFRLTNSASYGSHSPLTSGTMKVGIGAEYHHADSGVTTGMLLNTSQNLGTGQSGYSADFMVNKKVNDGFSLGMKASLSNVPTVGVTGTINVHKFRNWLQGG